MTDEGASAFAAVITEHAHSSLNLNCTVAAVFVGPLLLCSLRCVHLRQPYWRRRQSITSCCRATQSARGVTVYHSEWGIAQPLRACIFVEGALLYVFIKLVRENCDRLFPIVCDAGRENRRPGPTQNRICPLTPVCRRCVCLFVRLFGAGAECRGLDVRKHPSHTARFCMLICIFEAVCLGFVPRAFACSMLCRRGRHRDLLVPRREAHR